MFPILARSLSSNIVVLPTYCKLGDKKCEHDLMMEKCSDGTLRLMNRGYPWFGTVTCSFAFVLSGNSKVVVYHLNRSGLHLNRAGMDKFDIFFFLNKNFHRSWLKMGSLSCHTLSVFMNFAS